MRKVLFLICILIMGIVIACNAQQSDYCQTEDFGVISPGYIAPKSVSLGIDFFTKIGLVIGGGGVYTVPKTYETKEGSNTYKNQTNSLDIYSYVGWRIFRIDYKISVFGIAGWTMGDVEKFQPFTSIRVLFPINQKAISIEPVYILNRGMTAKLSFHIKL